MMVNVRGRQMFVSGRVCMLCSDCCQFLCDADSAKNHGL